MQKGHLVRAGANLICSIFSTLAFQLYGAGRDAASTQPASQGRTTRLLNELSSEKFADLRANVTIGEDNATHDFFRACIRAFIAETTSKRERTSKDFASIASNPNDRGLSAIAEKTLGMPEMCTRQPDLTGSKNNSLSDLRNLSTNQH